MAKEPYPLWEAAKAAEYKFGSKVYWVNPTTKVGYGFQANETYKDGKVNGIVVEPPSYSGWTFDPRYAVTWSPKVKYVVGDRVLFEIGDPTKNNTKQFIYVASPRYFGGHEPPNEEVDEDGIRTWLVYFQPKTRGNVSQFMSLPWMNKFEVGGVDINQMTIPEDWFNMLADVSDANVYKEADGYKYKHPEYINSVFEGNPYDSYVYEFWDYDQYGAKRNHLKKGIHRAEIYSKRTDNPQGLGWKSIAKRQWFFTQYLAYSYYAVHYPVYNYFVNESYQQYSEDIRYGFSAEIWPNKSESEYSLVPHNLYSNYFFNFYQHIGPMLAIGYNQLSINGAINPPDSPSYPATNDKDGFMKITARLNNETFAERKVNLKVLIQQTFIYYVPDGNGYYQTKSTDNWFLRKISIDTNESSYKYDKTVGDWVVKDGITDINFNSLKTPQTMTYITIVAAQIE